MKKIVFYNNWHNGDVFVCKEFIREITNHFNLPTYYCHDMKKCFYKDINLTECDRFEGGHFHTDHGITIKDNVAYINTWYNSEHGKFYSGSTLITLYNYFKHVYSVLGLEINKNYEYYIPRIDMEYYKNKINHNLLTKKYDKKILICNNIPLSGQAQEYDWSDYIDHLGEQYPNYLFLITNDGVYKQTDNVVKVNTLYTVDYNINNDLMEISYISTFCDIIVGRSSGPFSCCFTVNNIGTSKKIINVTKWIKEGHFGFPNSNIYLIDDSRYDKIQILNKIKSFM